MHARIFNGEGIKKKETILSQFSCVPSTLTGSVIGSKSAITCSPGEVLCMFDMGQMNSGGLEQRG